ncbi:hypothetical protein Psesu_2641 [Pseudoxanthomonas suwonensis 11-1]|uniref:TIGR02449 family protein n=2 Tax=Pseudoxanthomonas suwonensis TaxID=314722 RepID=E6WWJ3_PSEUU|nr:hypothetical protein Psesu_2641 [Pseudoxanthomonas suwonensis 11-1]
MYQSARDGPVAGRPGSLDRRAGRCLSWLPMEPTPDVNARIRALAARVEALADRCQRLADENRSLRLQQEQLMGERAQLLLKNEQARSRVEAMIARLRSLEQHT